MQPTQTGIATALALVVVILFFIIPGLWPFSATAPVEGEAAVEAAITTPAAPTTTTMPTVTEPVTELMMKDEIVGTGATAETGDTVTVHYIGTLTNGTVFDASRPRGADGFTFNLGAGQVIKGWDQGVAGMKEGGKRILVIPASLAYGDQTMGPIPAGSTLVFQVEVLKVQKAGQ